MIHTDVLVPYCDDYSLGFGLFLPWRVGRVFLMVQYSARKLLCLTLRLTHTVFKFLTLLDKSLFSFRTEIPAVTLTSRKLSRTGSEVGNTHDMHNSFPLHILASPHSCLIGGWMKFLKQKMWSSLLCILFLKIFFWVAICHSFYVYFLSYNTLQNIVGSHHTIYDEAWAG